jgi:hypothetical protein
MKTKLNRAEFMIAVNGAEHMMIELGPAINAVKEAYVKGVPINKQTGQYPELTEVALDIFSQLLDDVSNKALIEHKALSHIKIIPFPDEEYRKPMSAEELVRLIKDPSTDPAEINKPKKRKLDS